MSSKVASLWRSKKEGAKSFASGHLDVTFPIMLMPGSRLVLMKNQKTKENHPDLTLMVFPADDGNGSGGEVVDNDIPWGDE